MTILEALDITIRNLSEISVPAILSETVSRPIYDCIGNLKAIRQALVDQAPKEPEAEEGSEEGMA